MAGIQQFPTCVSQIAGFIQFPEATVRYIPVAGIAPEFTQLDEVPVKAKLFKSPERLLPL